MPEEALARYHGDVQGVGFRYTAREVARSFAVTGYVKNITDGSVEILAQGDQREVRAFLAAVERRMGHHIGRRSADWREAGEPRAGFTVLY